MKQIEKDELSEEETVRRADAALKRALNTPHKPHAPLKSKVRKKSTRTTKKPNR